MCTLLSVRPLFLNGFTHFVLTPCEKTCGCDPKASRYSKTVVLKYTNTTRLTASAIPRTNGKKKVFEFLYKHSSTAITNSQRVKVVPAPYGVRQPVASYRPLARTTNAILLQTRLSLPMLACPTYDTFTTVGGTQHDANGNECGPALPQRGIVRDLPIRGVTAAIVGRFARQPEWRRRQVQYIAARRL